MKKLLIVSLTLLLVGCSINIRMKLNEEKRYKLEIDGGKIKITTRCCNFFTFWTEIKVISGDFDFYPDKFMLFSDTPGSIITDINWTMENEKITDHVHLKKGDVLICRSYLSESDYKTLELLEKWREVKLTIPPNSSLQRNSKDVMQHKIEITFKKPQRKKNN